jgi:alkanesulfonate monooxygenase SsuD/methylene tetrahydromethanopterin reductase-like flavin-dependent oxidoreductase (luciferase family)
MTTRQFAGRSATKHAVRAEEDARTMFSASSLARALTIRMDLDPRLILGVVIFLPRSSEDIAELARRSNAWLSESSVSPRMHLDQNYF